MTCEVQHAIPLDDGTVTTPAALMIAISVSIGWLTGREVFRSTPMAALREGQGEEDAAAFDWLTRKQNDWKLVQSL